MASKQTDIIISGAGAAGLTLSILLARGGLRVAIIDPADKKALSHDALSGRTVALMNSSLNILSASGVWPALAEISNPLKTMTLMDVSRGAPIEEPFHSSDIGEAQFGFNVPNNALRAALFKAATQEKNITFHLGRKLANYDDQGHQVSVSLDNDKTLSCALLVGADGRNSKVREIAGIDVQKRAYDQSAITCVINHSRAHNNTSTEFHRPDGPLALVPLPGNRSSVVWVNKSDKSDDLLALKKTKLEQHLQAETHDVLGGITLASDVECYPLCAIKAKSLTAARVALVAEAAHVMSPITAQGLNLSLRDVAALAEEVIDAARVGQDIGSAMTLRQAGLKALSFAPPLKKLAMRVGLAPALDAGRLARGKTL